ncbi:LOB domain-containing protein 15-like, partial [Morus notabilis]|uniref:LOB domain-containing protein 15-like n=1 Tax=Morus notabilis TaxID=981085 RepID=UPI000CECECE0
MSRDRDRLDEIGKRIRRSEICDAVPYDHQNYSELVMGRTQSFNNGLSITPHGTLNTIIPCAACKLLRRRCAEECPFSPYFSPQEPQKFAAVHKVFGASNVSKMLMELPESQRADAANSLVYEANLRIRDPVYGCMGIVSALQQQIQTLQAEFSATRTQILRYKYREATSHMIVSSSSTTTSNLVSPHHHGVVSIASLPQAINPLSTPPAPITPAPPPPPPSIVVSSSSTSSTSSL